MTEWRLCPHFGSFFKNNPRCVFAFPAAHVTFYIESMYEDKTNVTAEALKQKVRVCAVFPVIKVTYVLH